MYFYSSSPVIGSLEGDGSVWLGNQGTTVCTLTLGGNNASTSFYGEIGDTGRTFALGINGGLTDAGCLTKVGTGTFTLYGQNWYAGVTTVNNGALVNNGLIVGAVTVTPGTGGQTPVYGGTGTTEGLVTVNVGGTVTGTGLLSGGLASVGGSVAPGNGVSGTLTVSGSLTLNSAAKLYYGLGASSSDVIVAGSSTLSLSGAVVVSALPGFAVNNSYTLMTYTAGTAPSVASMSAASSSPLSSLLNYTFNSSTTQVSLNVARNTTAGTFTWIGPTSGAWDGSTNANWTATDNTGTYTILGLYPGLVTSDTADVALSSTTPTTITLGSARRSGP